MISQKRVQTLVNNLQKTSLEEMELVINQLIEDDSMSPVLLRGLLRGCAEMVPIEIPVPIPGYEVQRKQPKMLHLHLKAASNSKKIETLKLLRNQFGWPLKEAKTAMDSFFYEPNGALFVDPEGRLMKFWEGSEELLLLKQALEKCNLKVQEVVYGAEC